MKTHARSIAARQLARLAFWTGVLVGCSIACSSSNPGSQPALDAGAMVTPVSNDGDNPTSDASAGDNPTSDVGGGDGPRGTASDATADASEAGHTPDDGPSRCNGAALSDGGRCPPRMPGTLTIIGSTFSTAGGTATYGIAPDLWDVYTLASAGQQSPTLTPTANAVSFSATLAPTATGASWVAVGVSIDGTQCIDETNLARGIVFTLSGSLGGCLLYLDAITSEDESSVSDPCRGACTGAATACVAPSVPITGMGMVTIPNMSFSGGSPDLNPNTTQLIGFRWRLVAPDGDSGGGCTANLTISNVQLFGV